MIFIIRYYTKNLYKVQAVFYEKGFKHRTIFCVICEERLLRLLQKMIDI